MIPQHVTFPIFRTNIWFMVKDSQFMRTHEIKQRYKLYDDMNISALSNIFLLKRSIDLSLLRQGFHIPPEFHALVYAALGRELHHGEGCDVQLMVEALTDSVNPTDDIKKKWSVTKNLRKGGDKSSLPFTFSCKLRRGKLSAVKCFLRIIRKRSGTSR